MRRDETFHVFHDVEDRFDGRADDRDLSQEQPRSVPGHQLVERDEIDDVRIIIERIDESVPGSAFEPCGPEVSA